MLKALSLQVREWAFATTLKQNEGFQTTLTWNINAKKTTIDNTVLHKQYKKTRSKSKEWDEFLNF